MLLANSPPGERKVTYSTFFDKECNEVGHHLLSRPVNAIGSDARVVSASCIKLSTLHFSGQAYHGQSAGFPARCCFQPISAIG